MLIVTRLDDRGYIDGKGKDFSRCNFVNIGSGPHPEGTESFYAGVKRPGREADHISNANVWSYTSSSFLYFFL
jgi:hypothetical protein